MKQAVMIETIEKYFFLFGFGGISYYFIEIFWRGYSHYSMIICGGLCFVLTGALNQAFSFRISLLSQMVLSSVIITVVEFATGLVVNIWLSLNVWDYSNLPYNLLGQVCLPYTMIWFFLSLICIFCDDFLRYKLFDEKKPHYKIL